MILSRTLLAAAALLAVSGAQAESCRTPAAGDKGAAARTDCRPSERLQPYEPGAARTGRDRGFIDLGNGTEVRVGGRAQMDYDVRR
jgi:hypothetical protein